MSTNIFEKASRQKLTFTTNRGLITVDQLWDLPLKNGSLTLNSIALGVKSKLNKTDDVVDLVDGDTTDLNAHKEVERDKLRLEVVMHVIKVLKGERDARENHEAKLSKLRVIDDAIAEQERNELVKGSAEELKKRRAAILNGE